MPSSRRVGVIGSSGQLGTDVVDVLQAGGHFELVPLTHIALDVTNAEQTLETVKTARLDVVVNCAAFHRVDECEAQVAEAFRVNGQGALHVARACEVVGALCVYISSDYVFCGDKGAPYTEDDRPGPVNVYGVSKVAGELLAQEACSRTLVLRISSVFGRAGARGKGGNFIEAILAKARAGGPVRVVSDQWMSPTYTRDAAGLLKALLQERVTGVVHGANAGRCSWFEFAQEAVRAVGLPIDVEPTSVRDQAPGVRRPRDSSLATVRGGDAGGARLPWQDALARYLREKGHM
jgi:dTDP-4-dehydrorhamnose reductase